MKNFFKKINRTLLLMLILVGVVTGCGKWNSTPASPVSSSSPSATYTVTGSVTATRTITPTVTFTPPAVTNTPTLTTTSSSTSTATLTATATLTTTATPTSVAACPNPAAVNLGTAGNYVILAETGITDVPSSAVTGDIANSGTGTQIGLTCAEVNGTIYEYDGTGPLCFTQATAAIDIAITDKGTAYTNANGQADCVIELGAGTISGQTLTRGTYVWAGNVTIPTDLHLDALGDPNARWIFQIGGTLTQASAVTVFLDNGALAQNVVWTTADFVQIGTTAHLEGTVISYSYIALQTGASVHGRLLSHTAVTLDHNIVTVP